MEPPRPRWSLAQGGPAAGSRSMEEIDKQLLQLSLQLAMLEHLVALEPQALEWLTGRWRVFRIWPAHLRSMWGWYGGWSTPPWGRWGARSAAWGLRTLATAAVINNAVNDAIAASQTTIVVPDTTYQLFFNSVQTSGDQVVYFVVSDGGESRQISADCSSGTLAGQEPSDASEAQLLNAACQVAFGA